MKKLVSIIKNLDLAVAGIMLVAIVFMTIAGVFMRKLVGQPFAWLEEMQLFFFVWLIFFGGSVAFRTGNHVGIDIVAERLGPRARRVLDIMVYIITMLVLIYILKGSGELAQSVTKKVTPYLKISYWVIDAATPIGCVLMMLQYSVNMAHELFFKTKKEVS